MTRRNVQGNSLRAKSYISLIILLIAIATATLFLIAPYSNYTSKLKKLSFLKTQIEELRKERSALADELQDLKTKPEAVERVAREKFGMSRQGEKIYHFDEQPKVR